MGQRLGRALDAPSGVRIGMAAALGALAGLLPQWRSGIAACLGGWAVAGFVFVAWTWLVVVPMDAAATSRHALREAPDRAVAHLIVLLAAAASLVGLVAALVGGGLRGDPVALAAVLAAIVASWSAVHTVFALRYARMYYTPPVGGIDFHQDAAPRYTDFTYLAVTVGMSFAVSDTDLSASSFRRTAQAHALLAYLFGTVIVALLVNLVAGLAG
jgi:uncharacterized membrane protein